MTFPCLNCGESFRCLPSLDVDKGTHRGPGYTHKNFICPHCGHSNFEAVTDSLRKRGHTDLQNLGVYDKEEIMG